MKLFASQSGRRIYYVDRLTGERQPVVRLAECFVDAGPPGTPSNEAEVERLFRVEITTARLRPFAVVNRTKRRRVFAVPAAILNRYRFRAVTAAQEAQLSEALWERRLFQEDRLPDQSEAEERRAARHRRARRHRLDPALRPHPARPRGEDRCLIDVTFPMHSIVTLSMARRQSSSSSPDCRS